MKVFMKISITSYQRCMLEYFIVAITILLWNCSVTKHEPLPVLGTVPDFTLTERSGQPFGLNDLRGHIWVVDFIFTNCAGTCPIMTTAMADLQKTALQEKWNDLKLVSITVDPERDTPEVLGAYVKNFGPRFVGLTGSPEAIAEAAKAYRVTFAKFVPEGQEDNQTYSIDHSAIAYLMGPDGKFVTHFAYGTPADKMTETLRRYL